MKVIQSPDSFLVQTGVQKLDAVLITTRDREVLQQKAQCLFSLDSATALVDRVLYNATYHQLQPVC